VKDAFTRPDAMTTGSAGRTAEWLDHRFFTRAPWVCARELIGCVFEWRGCVGEIVEAEAYAADGDPACHTFSRPSARRFVEQHAPGTSYVYLNYGVHWLFNLLVKGPAGHGFVLFRALEPLAGLETMRSRRRRKNVRELCSGPGRLTQALGINGLDHAKLVLEGPDGGIRRGQETPEVVDCQRIGISKGADLPWRFCKDGAPSLSRPPDRR